jgi:predicted flap endonuclease-1-like 5' DNA nuclease
MLALLCKLWPYLAGGLIGWLISGWFARRLKYGSAATEKIVEKKVTVEKVIDNPEHLSLISSLQSDLQSDNEQIGDLKSRLTAFENVKPEVVEKIVEKEVIKTVDNPQHVEKINLLEKENGKIAGLMKTIQSFESRKPEVIEKIVEKEVIKQVDNPQHLSLISTLEDEIASWKRGPKIDVPAAKAAGIAIKAEDDFTAIEGVGPKISELIHADGIKTFAELSNVEPSRLQKILDKAGSNFQMANPGTWPDQANLACNNRWPALKALQDILDGGVYPDVNASTGGTKMADNPQHIARIDELEKQLAAMSKGPEIDIGKAKAAGFNYRNQGNTAHVDFTVIEGIGPKIDELIHGGGIHTYRELAMTDPADIQKILDNAGSNFALAKPGTWPAQSGLAANNQWEALKAWQDILDGGEE